MKSLFMAFFSLFVLASCSTLNSNPETRDEKTLITAELIFKGSLEAIIWGLDNNLITREEMVKIDSKLTEAKKALDTARMAYKLGSYEESSNALIQVNALLSVLLETGVIKPRYNADGSSNLPNDRPTSSKQFGNTNRYAIEGAYV